jgi:hypothetical protein
MTQGFLMTMTLMTHLLKSALARMPVTQVKLYCHLMLTLPLL